MKKLLKKSVLVVATMVMTFGVVACGSSITTEEVFENAKEAVKKDPKSFSKGISVSLNYTIKEKGDSKVKYSYEDNSEYQYDEKSKNSHDKSDYTYVEDGDKDKVEYESYSIYDEDDDVYTYYIYGLEGYEDEWVKIEFDGDENEYEIGDELGFNKSDIKAFSKMKDVKYEKEDKVNDEKTYVVSGKLSMEDYLSLFDEESSLTFLYYSDGDAIDLSEYEDFDEKMNVTLQFYKESGRIASIEFDYSKVLKEALEDENYRATVDVKEGKRTILYQYDKVDEDAFDLPKDAKKAEELGGSSYDDDDDDDYDYDYDDDDYDDEVDETEMFCSGSIGDTDDKAIIGVQADDNGNVLSARYLVSKAYTEANKPETLPTKEEIMAPYANLSGVTVEVSTVLSSGYLYTINVDFTKLDEEGAKKFGITDVKGSDIKKIKVEDLKTIIEGNARGYCTIK